MEKLNLDAISSEITKKRGGIETNNNQNRKDKFLNDLMAVRNGGQITESIKKLKTFTDVMDGKGNTPISSLTKHVTKNVDPITNNNVQYDEYAEREMPDYLTNKLTSLYNNQTPQNVNNYSSNNSDQLYEEVERRKMEYSNNYGNHNNTRQQNQPQQLNEGKIIEDLEKKIMGTLYENLGIIADDALKNAVFETYTSKIFEKVLKENRVMLKGIIKEIIIEMKKK